VVILPEQSTREAIWFSEDVSRSAIDAQIHVIRGASVMLDFDLANLYGVATGVLLQAVRRNRKRFPPTSCFLLLLKRLRV
jgi:hypothetical protein